MQEQASASGTVSRLAASVRPYLRAETLFFVATWVLLLAIGRERLFRDPGTFWHTAVGERMLVTRQLIERDPFTFTRSGEPWIAHQWLGEVAMALAHRVGGLDAKLLLATALLAAVLAWIAGRLTRAGLHGLRATAVMALVLAVAAPHLHVRPHLASIALLALTVGVLLDVEAGRVSPTRLWWLAPLFVLWANVHGGVLAGIGTLGLALAGFAARRRVCSDAALETPHALANTIGAFVACCAAPLVNPFGLRLPQTWLTIMGSSTLTRAVDEHRPLELASVHGALVCALALLYLVMLTATWSRSRRVTWLLPLVWLYLAWSRVRHGPLFAVTTALVLADMLAFLPALRATNDATVGTRTRAAFRAWLLPASLVATGLVLQSAGLQLPLFGRGWARLDPTHWPTELLDELRAHEHDVASGTPIFNEDLYGGFLEHFTPGYRVFVDDRFELYVDDTQPDPERWLSDFSSASQGYVPERMQQWEQRYGRFELALVRTRAPNARGGFDLYFRSAPEWQALKRTATATLYLRKH
jgi:hypothetical protein